MRATFLFIVLSLTLCTFVSAFNKRTVTPATIQCINIVNSCGNQTTILNTGINSYTTSQGYSGALSVQSQEQTLEGIISNSITICCSLTIILSDEDAAALIAAIATLRADILALLSTIVSKKSVFDSVSLVTPIIKSDISSLYTKFGNVIKCWITSFPIPYSTTLQGYVDDINSSFNVAVAAYA